MKKLIFLAFIITFISTTAFAGGPWPQKKGKAYIKLSEWWTVFDTHFTTRGFEDPNTTTGIFNTSVFVEYGFSDRLTGIVNAPVLSRTFMNNIVSGTTGEINVAGEAINTIGDIDLGLKYSLNGREAKVPMALTLTLGIPTGETAGGTQENLATGDGEFNQMIRYDIGTGFKLGDVSAYSSGYAAFNNRTNDFSEELRYGLELGLGFAKEKIWLVGKFDVSDSFKNGSFNEAITNTSIFADQSEFVNLGAEINVYVTKKLGISASYTEILTGEIIAASPSYSVGVFLDLSKE